MNPTTSQQALSQLQEAQSSAQNPNDILNAQNSQFGVQGAQDTVTGLRGAINNTTKLLQQVAPSVMGRTGNSLVTNAQATRQIANEQAPLSTNLTDENTQLGSAATNLSDLQSKAQTAASGIYQGQQDKLGFLQNLYNSLFGAEKDAADRAFQQQQLAEQARQADLQAATSRATANSGINLGSLLSPNSPQPTSPGNQPTLRQTWQQEANAGDWNAQVALNYAGNDGRYDGPVNSQSELNILKSMGIKGNFYLRPAAKAATSSKPAAQINNLSLSRL